MPRCPRDVSPRSSTRAFTLIELLTVIAVIGILVAILIPVTGRVRASAKQSRCMANLRTISQAFGLYAADNQGYYPAVTLNAAASGQGRRNKTSHWEWELIPYVGVNLRTVATTAADTLPVFAICPDGQTGMNGKLVHRPGFVNTSGASDPWGYAYLYQVKAVEIRAPAKTVLAGDSDAHNLVLFPAMLPDAAGRYLSGDPVRHSGKANYLFADGHVETLDLVRASAAVNTQ